MKILTLKKTGCVLSLLGLVVVSISCRTTTSSRGHGKLLETREVQLDAGRDFTCLLRSGALKCWGSEAWAEEQLGAGITKVAVGEFHHCVIQEFGLKCWGRNDLGELGDGTQTGRTEPKFVLGLQEGVSDVSVGDQHTCAIQNGAVSCWGSNEKGQLGDGTFGSHRPTPVAVLGLERGVSQVVAGEEHSCALKQGAVYCWGQNSEGQLGDGTFDSRTLPRLVVGLESDVTELVAGGWHNCAIKNSKVYCWGGNSYGQLGDRTYRPSAQARELIEAGFPLRALDASLTHTCANRSGAMVCWGLSHMSLDRNDPQIVDKMESGVGMIALGWEHACVLKDMEVICWGLKNHQNELGDQTRSVFTVPTLVRDLKSNVTNFSSDGAETCVIQFQRVKCSKRNKSRREPANPTFRGARVEGLGAGVSEISVTNRKCAIAEGALKCWGRGAPSEDIASLVPGFESGVTRLSDGGWCVLRDGGVYCFRDGEYTVEKGWESGVTDIVGGYAIKNGALQVRGKTGQLPQTVKGFESGVSKIYKDGRCVVKDGVFVCIGEDLESVRISELRVEHPPDDYLLSNNYFFVVTEGKLMIYSRDGEILRGEIFQGIDSGVTKIERTSMGICILQDDGLKCWETPKSNSRSQGLIKVKVW
ncbi:hypothetical protein FRD01_22900 [Microvenator marinus]|uniref:RCC1-like domain-containing protein n=1 Tax=Microvenator marinus TaxID=2600177 RepID=A0A5B8Y304_9DELT|nr:hypothetical protein FRD01_22900 [Microvenator marinus]